jgi:hypothetical protein
MTIDELVKEKIAILETAPEDLANAAKKSELYIWESVLEGIDKFETQDGKILVNRKNVSQLYKIIDILKKSIKNTDFQEAMKAFISSFDESANISDRLAKQIEKGFKPNQVQKDLLQISKDNAVSTLIGEGLATRLTQPFVELLTANVSAGNSLLETRKQLKTFILGTKDADGRLMANIRTNSGTALAVADASYSKAVADQVDAQWFRYAGGTIDTTRPFCKERAGKFFHRKEVEAWAKESWAGEIEGTNSNTIFNFRGGWNCRHSLNMVSIAVVPDTVIKRNIANGNYKP